MASTTLTLKFHFDPRPMQRAVLSMSHAAGCLRIALESHRLSERRVAQRHFDLGQRLAAAYPDMWEVFCVTTSEGRCRVISRPRGGWA